jgi:hypothetical protein
MAEPCGARAETGRAIEKIVEPVAEFFQGRFAQGGPLLKTAEFVPGEHLVHGPALGGITWRRRRRTACLGQIVGQARLRVLEQRRS